MRAVVTGGAGFIGSHLIEALVARGDEVVCVEHPGASKPWVQEPAIEWFAVGVDDVERLKHLFVGADVVFHLAALTQARSAADYYAVNTEGTAQVFQAAAVCGTPPRIVLASSLAAIGPCRNGDLLSKYTVPCPLSHYGQSKLLAETVAHAYADRVPATILRLATVYGPRERAVLKFFRLVRHGLAVTVGRWDRQVSLIYVSDVVQAMIAATGNASTIGQTYCLAHPDPVRWADFAREVGQVLGRKPILLSVPVPVARAGAVVSELWARLGKVAAILNRERVREIAQERWVCDPGPAVTQMGFRPEFPIARGVRETAAWYRKEGWL